MAFTCGFLPLYIVPVFPLSSRIVVFISVFVPVMIPVFVPVINQSFYVVQFVSKIVFVPFTWRPGFSAPELLTPNTCENKSEIKDCLKLNLSSPLLSGSPVSELGAAHPGAGAPATAWGGEPTDTESH